MGAISPLAPAYRSNGIAVRTKPAISEPVASPPKDCCANQISGRPRHHPVVRLQHRLQAARNGETAAGGGVVSSSAASGWSVYCRAAFHDATPSRRRVCVSVAPSISAAEPVLCDGCLGKGRHACHSAPRTARPVSYGSRQHRPPSVPPSAVHSCSDGPYRAMRLSRPRYGAFAAELAGRGLTRAG